MLGRTRRATSLTTPALSTSSLAHLNQLTQTVRYQGPARRRWDQPPSDALSRRRRKTTLFSSISRTN
jgi:hypothetical protein